MNNYSIEKVGGEYVVLADEQRVFRIASRRKAAKLVIDAAELLAMHPDSSSARGTDQSPVITEHG